MKRVVTGLLLVPLLGGCGLFGDDGKIKLTCDEPQAYQAERLGKPVEAPEGLDQLDVFKEMPIPEAQSEPRPAGSRCITTPPPIRSN